MESPRGEKPREVAEVSGKAMLLDIEKTPPIHNQMVM